MDLTLECCGGRCFRHVSCLLNTGSALNSKDETHRCGSSNSPASTIVWGLFSLQHSQISHVHAETVQLHDIDNICFSCNSSQLSTGLPNATHQSILRIPNQFFDITAKLHQQDTASLVLPEVDELLTLLEMGVSNEEKSLSAYASWNPARNEEFLQAVERTVVLSGERFLSNQAEAK